MSALKQIINPALVRTRNGPIGDIDTPGDEGEKAVILYEDIVRQAMGMYPWPFLTKTAELQRVGQTNPPRSNYSYSFELPVDGWYVWDFYEQLDRRRVYSYNYNFSRYYQPFAYPWSGYDEVYGTLGRITNGYFNSDVSTIFAHYTPRPSGDIKHLSIESWSPQFIEYVKSELMIGLEQGTSSEAEVSLPNQAIHRKTQSKMKTQAALENRKANRLAEPGVLQKMRGVLR